MMATGRLKTDNEYFLWLCEMVDAEDPDNGYLCLMDEMHHMEFSEHTAKFVKNDYNRVEDGRELRYLFFIEYGQRPLEDSPEGTCSVLEMLVALARKMEMSFGTHDIYYWFWDIMRNIGFEEYTDFALKSEAARIQVRQIIDDILNRRTISGHFMTFFPLQNDLKNVTKNVIMLQKKEEIWFQMNQYLIENYM